jgi:hypothetical protein
MTALATHRKALDELERKLAAVEVELAELPALEVAAIEEAVVNTPTASVFALNSKPARLRKRRETKLAERERLLAEQAARERVVNEQTIADAKQQVAALIKGDVARIAKREAALYRRAGNLLAGEPVEDGPASVYDAFVAILEAAEQRDELDGDVRARMFPYLDECEQFEWANAIRPLISPAPADFEAFLALIWDVIADPHLRGYGQPDGVRSDIKQVLPSLVPDRRNEPYRVAQVSGRVETRRSADNFRR